MCDRFGVRVRQDIIWDIDNVYQVNNIREFNVAEVWIFICSCVSQTNKFKIVDIVWFIDAKRFARVNGDTRV